MTQDHGWSTPQAGDDPEGGAHDGGGSKPQPSDGPAPFVPPDPPVPPVPPGSGAPGWGQPPKAAAPQAGAWASLSSWKAASAIRPGIIPLRPMVLGDIMDGAFQALRANPRSMIGISAVLLSFLSSVTLLPLASALTRQAETGGTDDVATLISGSLLPALLQMVAVLVLNGLLVLAVSDAVLGRRTPLGDLWSRVRGRLPAIFGVAGLVFLGTLGLFLVCLVPGLLMIASGAQGFGVFLFVLGMLMGIFLMALVFTRWSMAAPVLLLERRRALDSLRRSWNLVKGSTWRVFGILALAQIIVGIGSALLGAPFMLGAEAIRTMSENLDYSTALQSVLVSSIGEIAAGSIFYPFSAAVTALLYTDLRMRKEGLDVELIRAAQGGPRS
ncbi:MAG: hypothetical protein QG608_3270 [Actinomycetota bacterium]|nr:hypothetical protein [Actinomycetota bacterium]